jgi:hypothetical protein
MNTPTEFEWWRLREALHRCVDIILDVFERGAPRKPTPAPGTVKR